MDGVRGFLGKGASNAQLDLLTNDFFNGVWQAYLVDGLSRPTSDIPTFGDYLLDMLGM